MSKLETAKLNFSALTPADYPAIGNFLVGFDTADDMLKKMDSSGVTTNIGSADAIVYEDSASLFPPFGSSLKQYIAKDTGKTYYWDGAAYIEIRGQLDGLFVTNPGKLLLSDKLVVSTPVDVISRETILSNVVFNIVPQLKSLVLCGVTTTGSIRVTSCGSCTGVTAPLLTTTTNNSPSTTNGLMFQSCNSLTSINFPALVTNNQHITVSLANLTTMNFPLLQTVVNDGISVSSTKLTTISFPSLQSVFSAVNMASNSLVTTISLPMFNHSAMQITNNPLLTSLILTGLTALDGQPYPTVFDNNDSMVIYSFPNLATVSGLNLLRFNNHLNLTTIDLPSLTSMAGGSLTVNYNDALTSINAPLLTGSTGLDINGNPYLDEINFNLTGSISDYYNITNNTLMTKFKLPLWTDGTLWLMDNNFITELNLSAHTNGDMTIYGYNGTDPVLLNSHVTGNLDLNAWPNATGVSFSAWTQGMMSISGLNAITAVNAPSLTTSDSVTITNNGAITQIDLPVLVNLNNGITINSNNSLTTINIPSLITTNGSVAIGGNALVDTINLNSLKEIGGTLDISNLPAILSLDFPDFEGGITPWVAINNMSAMSALTFPSMTFAQNLSVNNAGALASFSVPSLLDINMLSIDAAPYLTTVDFANLTGVSLLAGSGNFRISNNGSLISINLPSFVGNNSGVILDMNGNSALTSINLSGLSSNGVTIYLQFNNLTVAALNQLYLDLDTAGGINGTILTNFGPNVPTGGLANANVNNLITTKGWTITL